MNVSNYIEKMFSHLTKLKRPIKRAYSTASESLDSNLANRLNCNPFLTYTYPHGTLKFHPIRILTVDICPSKLNSFGSHYLNTTEGHEKFQVTRTKCGSLDFICYNTDTPKTLFEHAVQVRTLGRAKWRDSLVIDNKKPDTKPFRTEKLGFWNVFYVPEAEKAHFLICAGTPKVLSFFKNYRHVNHVPIIWCKENPSNQDIRDIRTRMHDFLIQKIHTEGAK